MLKNFNEFIVEALGFSSTVGEYSKLCVDLINSTIDARERRFKEDKETSFPDYRKKIEIENARLKVSEKAATEFPLDLITIFFELIPVDQAKFGPYSGHYKRNYDKYRMNRIKNKRGVNIEIRCTLYVPIEGLEMDRELTNSYLRDVFNHELTHAFNDFKDPNFTKKYRLGVTTAYASRAYPYLMESTALKMFFDLLYVMTDAEMNAIIGERPEFRTLEELREYSGYMWSEIGIGYNAEEYREAILSELKDSEYLEYIDKKFGEFFVTNYRRAAHKRYFYLDPKILKLNESADLLTVLKFFEPYINSRAKYLKRKLMKKVTQTGTGSLI